MTYAGLIEDKSITKINPLDFEKKYGIILERIKNPKYFNKDKQWLKQNIIELVAESVFDGTIEPRNGCYIRPKVYRGMKRLDDGSFSPSAEVFSLNHDVVFEAFAHKWGKYVEKPKVRVFERGVRSDDRKHKCISNYNAGNVAKNAAKQSGFDEALLVDHENERFVLEGGGENIVVKDTHNCLWTPILDGQDILDGITLKIGLEIAKNLGIKINSSAKLPLEFVMGSKAAMFYGTATGNELLTCIFEPQSGKTSILDLNDPILLTLKNEYDNLTLGKTLNPRNEYLREKYFTKVPLEEKVKDPLHAGVYLDTNLFR